MKICVVITRSDSIGGAHVHVRDLSGELVRLGHEVTVLVGDGGAAYTEELRARGCQVQTLRHLVRPLRPLADFKAFIELRRVLVRLRPALVSTHSSKAGWLGRLAAWSLGIPVLFTAHGWAFADGVPSLRRQLYRLAEKAIAPITDRIITVSEHDRALALRLGVASASKLVVVHNGMPDVDATLHVSHSDSHPRLIMVARFDEQKDHETLIRALSGLVDLAWVLELVGDGPRIDAMRELVMRSCLDSRVSFSGARRDVAERLAKADVFILTSKWEGLPRSILEAMRACLPVVASDTGGVRELVVDGVTGYLVPRGDIAAVRDRLRALISTRELRARFGAQGRRRFLEHFTFNRMVADTLNVYSELGFPAHPPRRSFGHE